MVRPVVICVENKEFFSGRRTILVRREWAPAVSLRGRTSGVSLSNGKDAAASVIFIRRFSPLCRIDRITLNRDA